MQMALTESHFVLNLLLGSLTDYYSRVQQEVLSRTDHKGKAIVYKCNNNCGGFGDRFRGMTLLMFTAAMTGRAFFITHNGPTRLEEGLWPRELLWHTSKIPPTVCDWEERHQGGGPCLKRLEKLHVQSEEGELVSPFEKWASSSKPRRMSVHDVDMSKGISPWTRLFERFDWEREMISVTSNNPAAYSEDFIDKLIDYVMPRYAELGWGGLSDPELVHQMAAGLRSIKKGHQIGCALKFLFDPSPGLRTMADFTISRSFHIRPVDTLADVASISANETARRADTGLLPYETFSKIPRSDSGSDRISLVEHLAANGLQILTKGNRHIKKVVGIHIRLVSHGPETSFRSNGYPRIDKDDADYAVPCAEDLATINGWDPREVIYYVVSDSWYIREKFESKFVDMIATDKNATVKGVDRLKMSDEEASMDLLGQEVDFSSRLNARPTTVAFLTALAEMFVLAHCDGLVLTKSGFGKIAAELGLISSDVKFSYLQKKKHLHVCLPY
eukprot:GHVS01011553.1.p1 GENE.GHVS01011553.1~~GHVS01011553.1.p1  ORF type:complete len:501 (+),score=42.84 GHVS01011553.1:83-1585(+)